jgi:hypothetical protein
MVRCRSGIVPTSGCRTVPEPRRTTPHVAYTRRAALPGVPQVGNVRLAVCCAASGTRVACRCGLCRSRLVFRHLRWSPRQWGIVVRRRAAGQFVAFRLFVVVGPGPEGAERRKAQRRGFRHLRRPRCRCRSAPPFGAPPRRFLASGPCFRGRTAGGFAPARSRRVSPPFVRSASSHRRQPPLRGADGDPRPPGDRLARPAHGRRRPRSAIPTPRDGALG